MSMSISPVELVLYVEFVAAVQITTGAIPSEREEKTLHSVARMMLTYSTRAISGEQRRTGNLADKGQGNRGAHLALLCEWQQVQRRAHGVGCQSRSRGRGSAVA